MLRKASNAESVGQCQPRVCFETLGTKMHREIVRNPDLSGLRGFAINKRRRNSFRVAPSRNGMHLPRVAKAQPWAGIRERFQRTAISLLKSGYRFYFWCNALVHSSGITSTGLLGRCRPS